MKIESKYDVGHIFCVPRSYKRAKKIEAMFDGEIWTREEYNIEPTVKYKEIIKVVVTCDKSLDPVISYYVVDFGFDDQMSSVYTENRITNYSEEEAMAIATKYADEGKEYFGI